MSGSVHTNENPWPPPKEMKNSLTNHMLFENPICFTKIALIKFHISFNLRGANN